MIAVTAAASLTAAPLPAMAGDVFTYGRPQIIAERERLFEVMQLTFGQCQDAAHRHTAWAGCRTGVHDKCGNTGFLERRLTHLLQQHLWQCQLNLGALLWLTQSMSAAGGAGEGGGRHGGARGR